MNPFKTSHLIFITTTLVLMIMGCSPRLGESENNFPTFEEHKERTNLPEFNPTPKDSDGFPVFNTNQTKHEYIRPQNFRPYIRVLIGENLNSWKQGAKQEIKVFSGSPYGLDSKIELNSQSYVSFKKCGSKICVTSESGTKEFTPPLWYKSSKKITQTPIGTYRGIFLLDIAKSKLQVVNIVGLEDYVQGILPYEIGTLGDWGFEALKSQALAARTYTLKRLKTLDSSLFDLYSDTRDQVYRGTKQEYELSNKAVTETRGLVLAYGDQLSETFYHSTSGGYTADISKMWKSKPIAYLKGQPDKDSKGDSWSKKSSWSNWKYSFTLNEVSKSAKSRLKTLKAPFKFSKITDLKILSRTPSGRVHKLKVKTNRGSFEVKGDKTRWLFKPKGMSILASSWFWIKKDGSKFTISGKGFGHGIGLCQMGARARSRAGQSFETILGAYYPKTSVKKVSF